ncbi:hypothetical protein, partial [Pseudotabrizicola sediminis]|uniref:hypothetical protein n=1 Tax=Pseudotabrizicola sediminis TaxID=2486418 RepID=UPI001AEC3185
MSFILHSISTISGKSASNKPCTSVLGWVARIPTLGASKPVFNDIGVSAKRNIYQRWGWAAKFTYDWKKLPCGQRRCPKRSMPTLQTRAFKAMTMPSLSLQFTIACRADLGVVPEDQATGNSV